MKTRVLVTGASGQIGSELVPLLKKRYGDQQVLPTVFPPETARNLPWHADVLDAVDMSALTKALKEGEVDTVYHLGGILSAHGEQDPQLAWQVNVQGLKNVLDASRALGVSRVFWPSSIAVFGPDATKSLTPQSSALNPTTIYGLTKVTGELLCNYYFLKYGLDVRCLRYPGIVSSETLPGGGTTDYAVGMFYAAVKGEAYSCFVSRETVLPMMYMPDALRASVALMESDQKRVPRHAGYNLAAISFSAGELADQIGKRVPGFRVSYSPDSRQKIADSWPSSIDDSEARRDWGWKHEFDLDKMVDDMLLRLRAKLVPQQKHR
ncbi:MAG TPA: NAD-dependent epimerase/dehydratase family protein [Nitrososphaerales archaeon]|nr:NAD-dependent epimerase/dehydratase family protein [Nitrososphaerales archaeon]